MARLSDPRLAMQWQERLQRFERSELTVAQFCELEGYSVAAFYQWRRKLDVTPSHETPSFIPVTLSPSDLVDRCDQRVAIELPGGATVRIPSGATQAEQRQLIAAIVQATSVEGERSMNCSRARVPDCCACLWAVTYVFGETRGQCWGNSGPVLVSPSLLRRSVEVVIVIHTFRYA